ncbi:MAG: ABC transporter ATP-binding protein [Verrucomicrobiia bacterium]
MKDNAIEINHLSRSFGKNQALNNLNLSVKRGCVYGLLGHNGAGKTTLIKTLAGLIIPEKGAALINGLNPRNLTTIERQKIGYVSERQNLPTHMKVKNLIKFCSGFYANWDHELTQRILTQLNISKQKKINQLSQGQARQINLLLALAQHPEILLLDEPAANLDVVARREFLDEILNLIRQQERTVIFSSHILSDIERIADEIGILVKGQLKISASVDELKETIKKIRFYDFTGKVENFEIPGAFTITHLKDEILATLQLAKPEEIESIANRFRCRYEITNLNLEDIFIEITKSS